MSNTVEDIKKEIADLEVAKQKLQDQIDKKKLDIDDLIITKYSDYVGKYFLYAHPEGEEHWFAIYHVKNNTNEVLIYDYKAMVDNGESIDIKIHEDFWAYANDFFSFVELTEQEYNRLSKIIDSTMILQRGMETNFKTAMELANGI